MNKKEVDTQPDFPAKFYPGSSLLSLIRKSRTNFADVYGPYKLKKGEGLVFAQQFKYDPEIYQGEYELKTKLLKGSRVVVENDFDISFE